MQDFSNLLSSLDKKVDQNNYEKMVGNIDGKLQLLQQQVSTKCEQEDFNVLMHKNRELRQDLDFRNQEELKRFELYREELQQLRQQMTTQIQRKVEYKDLEKVQSDLRLKPDLQQVNQSISSLRNEVLDSQSQLKVWFMNEKKQQEEFLNERWSKQESLIEYLREDCLKNNEKFRHFSEEKKREGE